MNEIYNSLSDARARLVNLCYNNARFVFASALEIIKLSVLSLASSCQSSRLHKGTEVPSVKFTLRLRKHNRRTATFASRRIDKYYQASLKCDETSRSQIPR